MTAWLIALIVVVALGAIVLLYLHFQSSDLADILLSGRGADLESAVLLPKTPSLTNLYPYAGYQSDHTPQDFETNPLLETKILFPPISTPSPSRIPQPLSNSEKSQNRRVSLAQKYMEEVDRFIRSKDSFYAPGFIYNIDRLRQELAPPKELKLNNRQTFVAFLRNRPEVRVVGTKSLELVALTPFRMPGVPVQGYFHCVLGYCNASWESSESYADTFQICWRCGARVFPYRQEWLDLEDCRGLGNRTTKWQDRPRRPVQPSTTPPRLRLTHAISNLVMPSAAGATPPGSRSTTPVRKRSRSRARSILSEESSEQDQF